MATWYMISFQDPNSLMAVLLVWLHDYNMLVLLLTMLLIAYFIMIFFFNYFSTRSILHGNILEIIWTVTPMFLLFDMAMPSLKVLYFMEDVSLFYYSLKTVGHQWYWSYEYIDKKFNFKYDSYMVSTDDLMLGEFRLLEVDNRVVLPCNVPLRNIVTSADVIHSWAIPSLGLKIDAVPGRLNQISFFGMRSGIYYGQCSEICGLNHSFMPIVLEMVTKRQFLLWLDTLKD